MLFIVMETLNFKGLQLNARFKNKAFVGSIILRLFKEYFEDTSLQGMLKNSVFFVYTNNQFIKIEIFKQKKILLEKIAEKLAILWYTQKITDIYIKPAKYEEREDEYL